MSVERSIIAKVAVANMLPKRLLGQPDTVQRLKCATLIGRATKIKTNTQPDGEVLEGLIGDFELTRYDTAGGVEAILNSTVAYLPPQVFEPIRAILAEVNAKGELVNSQVSFGFDFTAFRSSAPIGYSWEARPLINATETDPLAQLKALIASGGTSVAALDKPAAAEVAEVPAVGGPVIEGTVAQAAAKPAGGKAGGKAA